MIVLLVFFAILIIFSTIAYFKYYKIQYPDISQYQGSKDKKIIIIGSGFSGILQAISLKKMNFHNFVIYEQYHKVGGVWAKSDYPGCACDVKSHLYSYSFEQNPYWDKSFPEQSQIQQYLEFVAKKYKIYEHVKFSQDIQEVRFQQDKNIWKVRVLDRKSQQIYEDDCNILISASGSLNTLNYPDFVKKYRSQFEGKILHCGDFDKDYSYKNQNVALIGNSASAVQIIPFLQKDAKNLVVFQRSPNYMVEKDEFKYSKKIQEFFKRFPFIQKIYRWVLYLNYEKVYLILRYKVLNDIGIKILKKSMNRKIKQLPQNWQEKLDPQYAVGYQKPCLTNNFYEVIGQKNVQFETDHAKKLEQRSIITQGGKQYQIDTIILATGYIMGDISYPIYGLDKQNRSLQQVWDGYPRAHKGTSNPNFPNFIQLSGANTVLGHNSQIFMIEVQQNYVNYLINKVFQKNSKRFDVKQEAFDIYQQMLEKQADNMPWSGNRPHRYFKFSGSSLQFWWELRNFKEKEYCFI